MNCSRVFINARFSFRFSFLHLLLFSCVYFHLFSCVFRKREIWGGIDLQRTQADRICLTKSGESCWFVVSSYHQSVSGKAYRWGLPRTPAHPIVGSSDNAVASLGAPKNT